MTEATGKAPRVRLGQNALAYVEAEAKGEPLNGHHLEAAIARLEGQANATHDAVVFMLKLINENILRLGSMVLAEVDVEEEQVLEALQRLQDSIAIDVVALTKDTPFHDPTLLTLREELERQVTVHREEMAKQKSAEIGDRER